MGVQGYLSPSQKSVRLLIVSRPLAEGVPQHVLQVLGSLDHARYEIDVVCPRASILWERLASHPAVRLHDFSESRRAAPGDLTSWARLLRLVAKADVIHAHSSKAGILARLAAAVRGRRHRCIFTPHGWSFWAVRGLESRLYEAFEKAAARWCRIILVVSEHERSAGLAAGIGAPEQYRVVRNGVDLGRFSAEPEPVPGRIVALGRLARQKRPDLAVLAFAKLRAKHPDASLHFVGDGPLRKEVEELVVSLGLQGSVNLLGLRDDVPAILKRATCLLLASDYEGCPYSVLEAMAASVPVVATRVGGVPELVVDGVTGSLVAPDNDQALAGALSELLATPELALAMGVAGRERARAEFSLESMTRRVEAVYDEIIVRRAMPARSL
jgi:glycosyltransferase involved in cell wall biosynthesis